jgi:hypothetical protein
MDGRANQLKVYRHQGKITHNGNHQKCGAVSVCSGVPQEPNYIKLICIPPKISRNSSGQGRLSQSALRYDADYRITTGK